MGALKKVRFVLIPTALIVWGVADFWISKRTIMRIHEINMSNAEAFKRGFDRHIQVGATAADLDTYLTDNPLPPSVVRSSTIHTTFLELAQESSPTFGCGRGSVGLILDFDDEARLKSVRAGSWSFDCS